MGESLPPRWVPWSIAHLPHCEATLIELALKPRNLSSKMPSRFVGRRSHSVGQQNILGDAQARLDPRPSRVPTSALLADLAQRSKIACGERVQVDHD